MKKNTLKRVVLSLALILSFTQCSTLSPSTAPHSGKELSTNQNGRSYWQGSGTLKKLAALVLAIPTFAQAQLTPAPDTTNVTSTAYPTYLDPRFFLTDPPTGPNDTLSPTFLPSVAPSEDTDALHLGPPPTIPPSLSPTGAPTNAPTRVPAKKPKKKDIPKLGFWEDNVDWSATTWRAYEPYVLPVILPFVAGILVAAKCMAIKYCHTHKKGSCKYCRRCPEGVEDCERYCGCDECLNRPWCKKYCGCWNIFDFKKPNTPQNKCCNCWGRIGNQHEIRLKQAVEQLQLEINTRGTNIRLTEVEAIEQ